MQVKDGELLKIVERLGHHYRSNINNRVMRKALLKMDLDDATWERIERLTEITELQRSEGYTFHELYEQVLAMALFVNYAHHRVLPNLRGFMSDGRPARGPKSAEGPNDKVLRDMAMNNFSSNLGILAEIVNDLYLRTIELDKQHNGNDVPIYAKMPELKQLGQLLT
jgi:hypothetical protein